MSIPCGATLMMRLRLSLLAAFAAALLVSAEAGAKSSVPTASPPRAIVGAGTIDVRELIVRSQPRVRARIVGTLPEFRPQDFRPFPVLAIAKKTVNDALWYKISLPGRPNRRTGWVRGADVNIKPIPWQIVVYRDSRQLQLWKGDKLAHSARVAVGAQGMETPTGLYYVTMRFKPVRQTFLGTFAFETSAYSNLSEWPGGGVVGLHGTWQPHLLGQAVSHGCVRLHNSTAEFLRDRVPVGTPIRIIAG